MCLLGELWYAKSKDKEKTRGKRKNYVAESLEMQAHPNN